MIIFTDIGTLKLCFLLGHQVCVQSGCRRAAFYPIIVVSIHFCFVNFLEMIIYQFSRVLILLLFRDYLYCADNAETIAQGEISYQ